MAWTSPRTWVAGEKPTAATLNTHIRDNFKSIGDAWTSYTPAWKGSTTNPVIGNGTITGQTLSAGKLTMVRVRIVVGSTTTFGSGTYSISIPSTPAMGAGYEIFNGLLWDTSAAARYRLTPFVSSSGGQPKDVFLFCDPTTAGNPVRAVTPTVPFTFATGDEITLTGVYEAA